MVKNDLSMYLIVLIMFYANLLGWLTKGALMETLSLTILEQCL